MRKELCCLLMLLISFLGVSWKDGSCETMSDSQNIARIHEKKILLLYDDPYGSLRPLTEMIKQKMQVHAYDIQKDEVPDAKTYDVILLGDVAMQDHVSKEMKRFLGWYDLQGKNVSAYWISAFHQNSYEQELKDILRHGNYLPGFGVNDDEIKELHEIDVLMNGWLTSAYASVPKLEG